MKFRYSSRFLLFFLVSGAVFSSILFQPIRGGSMGYLYQKRFTANGLFDPKGTLDDFLRIETASGRVWEREADCYAFAESRGRKLLVCVDSLGVSLEDYFTFSRPLVVHWLFDLPQREASKVGDKVAENLESAFWKNTTLIQQDG